MNSTMFTADRVTHLKIVAVALVLATAVSGISVGVRFAAPEAATSVHATTVQVFKAGKPMAAAQNDLINVR